MNFNVGDFTKKVGQQFVSLYALDKVGMNRFINTDKNVVTRNLKRGGMWYVSNGLIEQVVTGSSTLTRMDPKVFVDDVMFNSIASFAIEQTGVHRILENLVDDTINQASSVDDLLATAIIVETVNVVGKNFEDSVIKNLSKVLGIA
jgi:hypothetical protein